MNKDFDPEIISAARILWDYLRIGMPLRKADGILIFCSNDLRVAEYAANLFHEKWASWICPSGGVGRLTYDLYHKSEAEAFSEVMLKAGVPESAIYTEIKATNTAENIFFTRQILERNNLHYRNLIVLQKPYMERRTLAALDRYWPDLDFCISSPSLSFESYPFDDFSTRDLIQVMVGDFQRLNLYADRGWQAPQHIPEYAFNAFQFLVESGFTDQLANPGSSPSIPSVN
jgi:uncharacterized SAM-binding protein YcdF (DUF218 family)